MVPNKSTTNKRSFKHLTEYDRGKIDVMRKLVNLYRKLQTK